MERPTVICHMLASLDGKIDGEFFSAPECAPAVQKFAEVRGFYGCHATLYGTTTMQGGYAAGCVGALPHADEAPPREDYLPDDEVKNYIVSVDPQGCLAFDSRYIEKKNRPKALVIELLTKQASGDYLAYLRAKGIPYLFAGEMRLNCRLALQKLKRHFGIETLMLSGGGLINWSFMQEDLIDELSLVLAPVADGGRTAVSIFEKAEFLPPRPPAAFALQAVEQADGGVLWLRYLVKK